MLNRTIAFAAAVSALCFGGLSAPANAQNYYLGEVIMGGWNFCPRGTTEADGDFLPINSNQSLFSLYGCQFGGDCRTTFALPDLRGRAPIGLGTGPGLTPRQLAQWGGSETVTLNQTQLPSHSHTANSVATSSLRGNNKGAPIAGGINKTLSTEAAIYSNAPPRANRALRDGSVATEVTTTVNNTGGSQPHNNMSPFLTIRFCVATTGPFPSRN